MSADVDDVLAYLLALKRDGLLGGPYCPCCGAPARKGCAAGCVIGPAQPAPGTDEHPAVLAYASSHGLTFDCAHAELEAMRTRALRVASEAVK